jgi:hypothetical protein
MKPAAALVPQAMAMASELASVMTATSRWRMCATSCAKAAPSSSGSSASSSPRVTTTVVCRLERPRVKALGAGSGLMASRGLGRSPSAHSRSSTAWGSGSSAGVTIRARVTERASHSVAHHCDRTASTTAVTTTGQPIPTSRAAPTTTA